jgi:hypothetical protein
MMHLRATTLTICDRHDTIFWKRVPDTLPSLATKQRKDDRLSSLVQRGQCLDLALVLYRRLYPGAGQQAMAFVYDNPFLYSSVYLRFLFSISTTVSRYDVHRMYSIDI